jgi:hypothetical protein
MEGMWILEGKGHVATWNNPRYPVLDWTVLLAGGLGGWKGELSAKARYVYIPALESRDGDRIGIRIKAKILQY